MEFVKLHYRKSSCGALLVVGAALLGAGCGRTISGSKPAHSREEENYLRALALSDARMSAAQNFLGDQVVSLDARVTNRGSRPVSRLEIQLEFHDGLKQVVLREKAHPVNPRTRPLKPGESRPFRVTFEHMPVEWDRLPPTMAATRVEF